MVCVSDINGITLHEIFASKQPTKHSTFNFWKSWCYNIPIHVKTWNTDFSLWCSAFPKSIFGEAIFGPETVFKTSIAKFEHEIFDTFPKKIALKGFYFEMLRILDQCDDCTGRTFGKWLYQCFLVWQTASVKWRGKYIEGDNTHWRFPTVRKGKKGEVVPVLFFNWASRHKRV
jgi:hypothetical protein